MNNILAVNISDISTWLGIGTYADADTLIQTKITQGINFFVLFSALVAVIFMIVAGYTYITAAGGADKIEKAGKTITASVVGMIIVFVARVLVELVLDIIYK